MAERLDVAGTSLELQVYNRLLVALQPVETMYAEALRMVSKIVADTTEFPDLSLDVRVSEAANIIDEAMALARRTYTTGGPYEIAVLAGAPSALSAMALSRELGEAIGIVGVEARSQAVRIVQARLAEVIRSMGTFYAGKVGYGVIFGTPLMVGIKFGDKFVRRLAALQGFSTDEGVTGELVFVADQLAQELGEALAQQMRLRLGSMPIPAIGGTYSEPMEVTGQLARAIGVLSGVPEQARYVERARGRRGPARAIAGITVEAVMVGVRPGTRAAFYGSILNRTMASRPQPGIYSEVARARMHQWAWERGISTERTLERISPTSGKRYKMSPLDAIMHKIATRGTYGREWMANIATGIQASPRKAAWLFARQLERAVF